MGNIELSKEKAGMPVNAYLVVARQDAGWEESNLIDSYYKLGWDSELLVSSRSVNQLLFYSNKHLSCNANSQCSGEIHAREINSLQEEWTRGKYDCKEKAFRDWHANRRELNSMQATALTLHVRKKMRGIGYKLQRHL